MSLDAVSFLFAQVLTQIDYLFDQGHLSQESYASIAGALLQATPSNSPISTPTPASPAILEQNPISSSSSSGLRPSLPLSSASSSQPVRSGTSTPFLKFKNKPPSAPEQVSQAIERKGKSKASSTASALDRPKTLKELDEETGLSKEELGKVNRRIRGALEGGFLLSTVVDQALALTPFVPEGLREKLVEKTEEASGPLVRGLTDPRRQAAARASATKLGSSAAKVVRGGGGTSRASSSSSTSHIPLSSSKVSEPSFSYTASARGKREGEAALSVTSAHSFLASPDLEITTVIAASFIGETDSESASSNKKAQEAGYASNYANDYAQGYLWQDDTGEGGEKDPKIVTGADW